jgi:hypothetical protein
LAVLYLAAVIYVVDYWTVMDRAALRLVGLMAALMVWTKQEGIVLAACVLLLASLKALRSPKRELVFLILPIILVYSSWRLYLRLVQALPEGDFMPFSLTTLIENRDRIGVTISAMLVEMRIWDRWGGLWIGLIIILGLVAISRRPHQLVIVAAIALPLMVYSNVFVFSRWSPVSAHIDTSLSRLLLQVTPVVVLLIGTAMPLRPWEPVLEASEI